MSPAPSPVPASAPIPAPVAAAAAAAPGPGRVDCIIVGGGPAGMFLALLLVRQGISVALLESHADFDREFRGDTIHPSTLDVLDSIGLIDRVMAMKPGFLRELRFVSGEDRITMADLSKSGFKFPYIAVLPQVALLDILAEEARKYAGFHLLMGASVNSLLYKDGVANGIVTGVRYRQGGVDKELRAQLVVGADGRASRIRKEAGLELVRTAVPMDVIWFRTPHPKGEEDELAAIRFGPGRVVVVLDRGEGLQVGVIVPKKGYGDIRRTGIETFLKSCVEIYPPLGETIGEVKSWKDVALLSVECGHLTTWHRAGVLCIGDAAHIMSPVGGVGICYAVQDAVAAANLLTEPLRAGKVNEIDLLAVQQRREYPARFMQNIQNVIHKRLLSSALSSGARLPLPLPARLIPHIPILRNMPARMVGYGVRPETVHYTDVRALSQRPR